MNEENKARGWMSYGANCKDMDLVLNRIHISEIAEMIKVASGSLVKETQFLRTVLKYSKERYRTMKTRLPFVTFSEFYEGQRRFDNFKLSHGWMVDIDSTEDLDPALKERLLEDERVTLGFTSPSGKGLKLFFIFEKPFEDKTNYSSAYKYFTNQLALKYNITSLIDFRNCDVSRICFLCHDPDCVYRPDALKIDPSEYIPENTRELVKVTPEKQEIPEDAYRAILAKLGTKPKSIEKRPFVPLVLLECKEMVIQQLELNEIIVSEIEEIQYGLKIKCRREMDIGEVLIYYGKKGFSVLNGARKGLSQGLNEVCRQIIYQLLM